MTDKGLMEPGYRARAEAAEARVAELEADRERLLKRPKWRDMEAMELRATAAEAREQALRDGIDRLADTIHGDDGWEHSSGCEGEPDCFACIEEDLRRLSPPTADTQPEDKP